LRLASTALVPDEILLEMLAGTWWALDHKC